MVVVNAVLTQPPVGYISIHLAPDDKTLRKDSYFKVYQSQPNKMEIKHIDERTEWNCDLCCESFAPGPSTTISGTKICDGCINKHISAALAPEVDFPPRWAGTVLDLRDFLSALSPSVVALYNRKHDEWACPPKERIYCRHTDPPKNTQECGAFLGRRANGRSCRKCKQCLWYTCLCCLESFSTSDREGHETTIDHLCDPDIEADMRKKAFDGLKRGRDYQDCPSPYCERRVELKDGCNSMRCPSCQTEFCYVCGKEAAHGSGHWRSRCPQWNQPDSKHATYYNDDQGPEGNGDEEELNVQLEMLHPWGQHNRKAADATLARRRQENISSKLAATVDSWRRQQVPATRTRPNDDRIRRTWYQFKGKAGTPHGHPPGTTDPKSHSRYVTATPKQSSPSSHLPDIHDRGFYSSANTSYLTENRRTIEDAQDQDRDFRLSLFLGSPPKQRSRPRDSHDPDIDSGRCHTCMLPLTQCCCGTTGITARVCQSCGMAYSRCRCPPSRSTGVKRDCSCERCISRRGSGESYSISDSGSSVDSDASRLEMRRSDRYRATCGLPLRA